MINKTPQECYDYWRDMRNAPQFMQWVESVTVVDQKNSRWVARVPGGRTVEWESRITDDQPGKRIAWHSVNAAPITHAGVVSFEPAPGDRGTLVRMVIHYRPPATSAAAAAMSALGAAPAFEIKEDLRRFKQILETGEIATTRGQPTGQRSLFARAIRMGRGS